MGFIMSCPNKLSKLLPGRPVAVAAAAATAAALLLRTYLQCWTCTIRVLTVLWLLHCVGFVTLAYFLADCREQSNRTLAPTAHMAKTHGLNP